jgi:chemotaxis protein methyltransferase CheR
MPLFPHSFDYLRSLVLQRSAIVVGQDKLYLAEARLGAVARERGFVDSEAVVEAVRSGADRDLARIVVEAMTTNETSFFRDKHPFAALRSVLLPELMRARASERRLRIWSAACSSGQEAYSVAMLIRDHFPTLTSWDLRLLATDLSEEMLDRARAGRFTAMEVSRGLSADHLARHFTQTGNGWTVNENIRRMVEFRPANLIDPLPTPGAYDLILLRNVLIYFDPAMKKTILGRMSRNLRPDGYLMLGTAETTLNLDESFESIHSGGATYFRPAQRSLVTGSARG